ncbi:MAG: hypothetical protein JRI79_12305 [Deltaproteobacteria bacterium]|nr:hypothetical protein [Deltaproteobacteria bacterium]MBW2298944.1 hypothetical protein [Deltaproteobacteria bacterium]
MASQHQSELVQIYVEVDPGICGFPCTIVATGTDKTRVSVEITDSRCEHVQKMAGLLDKVTLRDIFTPIGENPIFKCAAQAGCHPSCIVPLATLKAVEAAMGMALPREVRITFKQIH